MTSIFIEGGDYTMVAVIILALMFGPPFLFFILGISYRKNQPKTSKVLFIIAVVYLLISLGICGSMML